MKKVPYSPYNRSYKYMSLQNQLAHVKNLQGTFGLVNSNLSITPSHAASYLSQSQVSKSTKKSVPHTPRTIDCSARLTESPRVIHRDRSFNKTQE